MSPYKTAGVRTALCFVGDDVIDELGPHRAEKSRNAWIGVEIPKNAGPRIRRVSLEINRNVDLSIVKEFGDFLIALSADNGIRSDVGRLVELAGL